MRLTSLLLAVTVGAAQAQQAAPPTPAASASPKDTKQPSGSQRRRAVKLYLEGTKLFDQQQFEQAWQDYKQAAALDGTNTSYPLAAEVAVAATRKAVAVATVVAPEMEAEAADTIKITKNSSYKFFEILFKIMKRIFILLNFITKAYNHLLPFHDSSGEEIITFLY